MFRLQKAGEGLHLFAEEIMRLRYQIVEKVSAVVLPVEGAEEERVLLFTNRGRSSKIMSVCLRERSGFSRRGEK